MVCQKCGEILSYFDEEEICDLCLEEEAEDEEFELDVFENRIDVYGSLE